jgi:hypothetical protein
LFDEDLYFVVTCLYSQRQISQQRQYLPPLA